MPPDNHVYRVIAKKKEIKKKGLIVFLFIFDHLTLKRKYAGKVKSNQNAQLNSIEYHAQ